MSTSAAYRHSQTYVLLWAVLLATGVASGVALALDDDPNARIGAAIVALSLGGSLLCLGRLVIEVYPQQVRWSFGYLGWPCWSEPIERIARVEVARCQVRFGSGIRGTRQHRQYNVEMDGPALRLHLHDGRSVTLGTPEPQRLATFIEARLPRARR
jgi:hypothetical protein